MVFVLSADRSGQATLILGEPEELSIPKIGYIGRVTGRGAAIEFDFTRDVTFFSDMETAVLPRPEAKRPWTYDEMAAELPESNLPTELWDGELIMSAAPVTLHQRIVFRVCRCFDDYVRTRKLGEIFVSPFDVVFSARQAVQPDAIYVSNARMSIVTEKCIRGVPDLLVEVISEGSWRRDRMDKKALYEQFGVAEYWIIDPDSRLIEVFTLVEGTYRQHKRGIGAEVVSSKLLADFAVSFEK